MLGCKSVLSVFYRAEDSTENYFIDMLLRKFATTWCSLLHNFEYELCSHCYYEYIFFQIQQKVMQYFLYA